MKNLQMQVDALMRLCGAEQETERRKAAEEVRALLNRNAYRSCQDPEMVIQDILLELGAPDHLVGYPYAVTAILLAVEDRTFIDSITQKLYPTVAQQYHTTPTRVERAIRHLVETAWNRGEWNILTLHFGNIVSAEKGKPTNAEFIARVANIAKRRMKEFGFVS